MNTYRFSIFIFFYLILIGGNTSTFAATLIVPTDHATIQSGIDAAEDGDTVLAADGIYKGDGNVNIDFKGKKITVKSENGPEATVIDCEATPNTRGFIFHNEETHDSVLDGFTIKNGRHDLGGGISCNTASPTIRNCIISWNTSLAKEFHAQGGGGIYCFNSDAIILECTITNNTAESTFGGGVFFEGESIRDGVVLRETASQPQLIQSTISENDGAGIYIFHTVGVEVRDCTVTKNSHGGFVCNFFSRGGTHISNSIISHNTGGGVEVSEYSILKVTDCLIKNNIGKTGGGIFCSPTSVLIVSNCIIAENIATVSGGGIAVISTRGNANITNCTISRNTANERGGGVYAFIEGSSFEISNSIVWGNTSNDTHNEFSAIGGWITIRSCDIRDGLEGIGRMPDADWFVYENNIDKDPLFVDADRGDYRLSRNSPAKNMGPQTSVVGTLSVVPRGKQLTMWVDIKRR